MDDNPFIDREHRRHYMMELIATVLLSIATVASAWCAYQSTRWGGVQATRFNEATTTSTLAAAESNRAMQLTTIDVGMFIQYSIAVAQSDAKLARFIERRFRPEFRFAFDSWMATKPETNPHAPSSPFVMHQYRSLSIRESNRLSELSNERFRQAREANQISDNYVMITVIFASVMFFSGVGSKLYYEKTRMATLIIAIVLFIVGTAVVATYPVH